MTTLENFSQVMKLNLQLKILILLKKTLRRLKGTFNSQTFLSGKATQTTGSLTGRAEQ